MVVPKAWLHHEPTRKTAPNLQLLGRMLEMRKRKEVEEKKGTEGG